MVETVEESVEALPTQHRFSAFAAEHPIEHSGELGITIVDSELNSDLE